MGIIETGPNEIGIVLWAHCQNLLDDPRIYSSGGHFVLQSRTGLTILVAGLMRNICVKLFEFSGPAVHFGAILLEVLI